MISVIIYELGATAYTGIIMCKVQVDCNLLHTVFSLIEATPTIFAKVQTWIVAKLYTLV